MSDAKSMSEYLRWSAAQGLVYNAKVEEAQYFRQFSLKFWCPVQKPKDDQQYAHLVNENTFPWLKGIPSQVFRNGTVLYKRAAASAKSGITKAPKTHCLKGSNRKLWLTRELFTIQEEGDGWFILTFGTKTKKGGSLRFFAHRPFKNPASLHIKMFGTRLFVSFSNEEASEWTETREEIAERLRMLPEEELMEKSAGYDRGVAIPLQGSGEDESFGFSDIQKKRLEKKERRRKRYQRKLARQKKGSRNSKKTKKKINCTYHYGANVRNDFAHKTSRKIVDQENVSLFVFEDLKVKNMTKSPEPKPDESGEGWLPNGSAAKAGLNKSILESAWGKTLTYTTYKAEKIGKLVITVDPKRTSQTCFSCGSIAKESRQSQSRFVCIHCGHEDNADHNAALVIKTRGVKQLLEQGLMEKPRRKTLRLNKSKDQCGAGTVRKKPVESTDCEAGNFSREGEAHPRVT